MTAESLLTILGMAFATYATRAGGLWLMTRFTPSPRVEAALQALPGTLLVALIAPLALTRGPVETVASLLVVLAMARTGNLVFAIIVGVGAVALLRAAG